MTSQLRTSENGRSAPGHLSVGDQRHLGLDGIANGPGRRAAAWGSFGTGAGSCSSNMMSARGNEIARVTNVDVLSRIMLPWSLGQSPYQSRCGASNWK